MTKQPTGALRTFAMAFVVLAMLFGISFIPPIYAEEHTDAVIRRTNIFSEFYLFNDRKPQAMLAPEINVADFDADFDKIAEQVAQVQEETSPTAEETSLHWESIDDTHGKTPIFKKFTQEQLDSLDFSAKLPDESRIVKIEDFADFNDSAMQRLYDKILSGESIHIGWMGDSFTESDILTADLREFLQETFGGGGAGFAPFHSEHMQFRRTIKTTASGWNTYHIILSQKKLSEAMKGDFFISGWLSKPQNGAKTRWDMTTQYTQLVANCNRARLLFIAREALEMEVILNGTEKRSFSFEGGEQVRQILIENEKISSLEVKILSGAGGFSGIGAEFFQDSGVTLDNLSVRSNNGQAMFKSNAAINAQVNNIHPYDLIVLQYGLNILSADRYNYSLYGEQIVKMVQYIQQCFPDAAIIVLGVSERSKTNENGDYVTMESAKSLAKYQRDAAQQCKVAFWDTYSAMRSLGGMPTFVQNGWAGRDYTHIGYKGGRAVAHEFYIGMLWGLQQRKTQLVNRLEMMQPVINQHNNAIFGSESQSFGPLMLDSTLTIPAPKELSQTQNISSRAIPAASSSAQTAPAPAATQQERSSDKEFSMTHSTNEQAIDNEIAVEKVDLITDIESADEAASANHTAQAEDKTTIE